MNPIKKILHIQDKQENGKIIEWDFIHKEYLKLIKKKKAPQDVYKFEGIPYDKANLFVIFSKRDTGKTTNMLLHSLLAYYFFNVKTEWVRQTNDMIKPTNTQSMFDTIISFNYIKEITNGKYSAVYYYRKELYLCNYTDGEKGRPKDIDDTPFLRYHAIEDMINIKSNYTSPNGDIIVLDEFQTRTNKENEFENFWHIVSTIKRKRISTKLFFLGNTITPYNYYFREMDITKHILKMTPNTKRLVNTEKGMHIYLEWTEPKHEDENVNEKIRQQELQYYGFDGLNSITGGGTWDIKQFPHITSELDRNKDVLDECYIDFMNYSINLKVCYNETFGYFVFARPCHNSTLEYARTHGKLIMTDKDLTRSNEVKGIGREFKRMNRLWALLAMGRMLVATNDIGALLEEFYETYK